ncbi:MAG: DNA-3-methyladenine glycosylase [Solirubrobacterales bacterium]
MSGTPLDEAFFARSVHDVAHDLVGCELLHGGVGGTIVETESYHRDDPACHAYGGPTPRSEILWGPPAIAYVYFSYGIHSLLNAVCEPEGEAAAVLIRALQPTRGVDAMRERRRRENVRDLCSGPGKLTEALAVGLADNGRSLLEVPFELRAPAAGAPPVEVQTAPRIGITKASEYPWRFCAAGGRFLSKPVPPAR